jgi:3-oxoacyl-[acyl-carrier-protein] synthase II
MMAAVSGIGWITNKEYGCVRLGSRNLIADLSLGRKDIFSFPFKGFGKLDKISAMVCCSAALALADAGIVYGDGKLKAGIVGANSTGCFQSDIKYFRDYLDSGRVMARGNLFIYTLPSSPMGEAAIHFGMQGPLFYIAGPEGNVSNAIEAAADIVSIDSVPAMLACRAEENEAVCFTLVEASEAGSFICTSEDMCKIAQENMDIAAMIERIKAGNTEAYNA